MKKYKVGLALSGGSAKGIAHIGVIKALHELGIYPEIVSGVSAGALVGGMYCDGVSLDDMFDFFMKSKFFDMVKFNFGLVRGNGGGVTELNPFRLKIQKMVRARTFEDLSIPLIVSATNLNDGRSEYFKSGPLIEPLIASSSVPVLFNPVKIDNKYYVDGGIISNIAANVLRDECEYLIGVHVNPIIPQQVTGGFASTINRVFDLVINGSQTEVEKASCDVLIETDKACAYSMFGTDKAYEIRQIGYETAMSELKNSVLLDKMR